MLTAGATEASGVTSQALLWRGWLWADQLEEAATTRRATRVEWHPAGCSIEGETSNRKFKICRGSDFLSRTGEYAEKCELTNQCLNIHSRNRHYRQNTSNDAVFLRAASYWQLLRICRFRGSGLKVLEMIGSSQKPSLWPNSQFLSVYTYIYIIGKHLCNAGRSRFWIICMKRVHTCTYTWYRTCIYVEWNISTNVFSGRWEKEEKS